MMDAVTVSLPLLSFFLLGAGMIVGATLLVYWAHSCGYTAGLTRNTVDNCRESLHREHLEDIRQFVADELRAFRLYLVNIDSAQRNRNTHWHGEARPSVTGVGFDAVLRPQTPVQTAELPAQNVPAPTDRQPRHIRIREADGNINPSNIRKPAPAADTRPGSNEQGMLRETHNAAQQHVRIDTCFPTGQSSTSSNIPCTFWDPLDI